MPGSAGGVRGIVAVGMGVSVICGVAVGALICATAVSNAAVSAALISVVGAAGWQAARSVANRLRLRKRRETINE